MNKASSGDNEYYTPLEVWISIKKYLPKGKIGCEPFTMGDTRIGSLSYFKQLGIPMIGGNGDFFKQTNYADYVLSNPPYTTLPPYNARVIEENLKYRIMKRLMDFNTPFMLLLPLNTTSGKYFGALFLKNGKQDPNLQIITYIGGVKYYKIDDDDKLNFKKQPALDSCFICWKMKLPQNLIYMNAPKVDTKPRPITEKKKLIRIKKGVENGEDYKRDFVIPQIIISEEL